MPPSPRFGLKLLAQPDNEYVLTFGVVLLLPLQRIVPLTCCSLILGVRSRSFGNAGKLPSQIDQERAQSSMWTAGVFHIRMLMLTATHTRSLGVLRWRAARSSQLLSVVHSRAHAMLLHALSQLLSCQTIKFRKLCLCAQLSSELDLVRACPALADTKVDEVRAWRLSCLQPV